MRPSIVEAFDCCETFVNWTSSGGQGSGGRLLLTKWDGTVLPISRLEVAPRVCVIRRPKLRQKCKWRSKKKCICDTCKNCGPQFRIPQHSRRLNIFPRYHLSISCRPALKKCPVAFLQLKFKETLKGCPLFKKCLVYLSICPLATGSRGTHLQRLGASDICMSQRQKHLFWA